MRKRLLTFLLLLLSASLIMSLIACGSEKEPDETKEAETENTGSETAKEDESATGKEEDELRENQEKITDFLTLYGRTVVQGIPVREDQCALSVMDSNHRKQRRVRIHA